MKLTTTQIAQLLDGHVEGHADLEITRISKIEEADGQSITFLSNPRYEAALYTSQAGAVIVNKDFQSKKTINATLIRVADPYLGFSTLLAEYQRLEILQKTGLESPHYLGENTTCGEGLYLGAFSYVGNGVKIGENVKIHPQVYIGDDVQIGNHTVLYPGVKIYPRSVIGSYCTLQAGAVIGSHGFGFAPQADGSYQNIPQVGNVILEDHVDIGANTTIDCATIGSTVIERGVKIDNLVQVAHNVSIGENTVIAAQTGISGSVKVGKNVKIGGQAGTVGHIHIKDGTVIGARAGITKSVTKDNQVLFGVVAFDHTQFMRSYAVYKKLPALQQAIQRLEQKLLNLAPDSNPPGSPSTNE